MGFIRRLRTEPSFLLRHASTLADAAVRRLRTRLMVRFSGTHQGRKVEPPWIQSKPASSVPASRPESTQLTLPRYPLSAISLTPGSSEFAGDGDAPETAADPEDYLGRSRWAFLTEALLAGNVDWERCLEHCVRWVESQPGKADPAWETYSSGERVANLLIFLAVMRPLPDPSEAPRALRMFVRESLDWIMGHLEYYGARGTNNHIINNARAIVMAGVALGDATAIAAGETIFRRCLPDLITETGFLRERSSHYQVIVLNWLLDAWWFLLALEGAAAAAAFLHGYVHRMISATTLLCESGTRLTAVIGDVSPDLSPTQSLARIKMLYPQLWPVSGESVSSARMADGWFRIDSGNSTVLGNFPPGPFPATFPTHGHGDLTSFVWCRDGREILVDRGRYRYTADRISTFQRHASGHNLVLVNGFAPLCESLVASAAWLPLPYAAARLEAEAANSSVLLAHDGFARSTPVARHMRRLLLADNSLTIEDTFQGRGNVELAFCWHFGEGFQTFDAQNMTVDGSDGRMVLKVRGIVGTPRTATVYGDPCGWISRTYGHRQPALGVCLSWQVDLPARVATTFELPGS